MIDGRPTDDVPHEVGHRGDAPECEAGARAKRSGAPATANPYPQGGEQHGRWHAGWLRPGMYIGDEGVDQ